MTTSPDGRFPVDTAAIDFAMKPTEPRTRSFRAAAFSASAFTLVELLVVIGIIAVLVGILLPVLGRAQSSARDVKCKANLRSIAQAAMLYAGDNKGSMPWGFTYDKNQSNGGIGSGATGWISWYSLLNRYMGTKTDAILGVGMYSYLIDASGKDVQLSKAFQCPEAVAAGFEQQVNYYDNPNVFVHTPLELFYGPTAPTTVAAPLKQSKLFADTVLFYDTPSMAGVSSRIGLPFFIKEQFCIPSALLDGSADAVKRNPTFRRVDRPELRFRTGPTDEFAALASKGYSIYQSIWFTTDDTMPTIGSIPGLSNSLNADMGANTTWTANIGNLRFRHQKNSSVNVVFSDTSVRSFSISKTKTYTGVGGKSYDTDLKRYMFMPKYPGVGPKGGFTGTGNG